MIISHNIMALNTQRQFQTVYGRRKKSAEKLASGFRVNRSADDAAGLAISEGMRRQINGLSQALQNTRDGVAFCHTADGALEEVSSILQRVSTLSVQSANGVYAEKDRNCIQSEVDRLLDEVDRICESTEFGGQKVFQAFTKDPWEDLPDADKIYDCLLKGRIPHVTEDIALEGKTLKADKANALLMGLSSYAMAYEMSAKNNDSWEYFDSYKAELKTMYDIMHGYALSLAGQAAAGDDKAVYLEGLERAKVAIDQAFSASSKDVAKSFIGIARDEYEKASKATKIAYDLGDKRSIPGMMADGLRDFTTAIGPGRSPSGSHWFLFPADDFTYVSRLAVYQSGFDSRVNQTCLYAQMSNLASIPNNESITPERKKIALDAYKYIGFPIIPPATLASGLRIQSGAESDEGMLIQVGELDRSRLGLLGVDVTTGAGASNAIGVTQGAIEKVSSIRGQIGASQNRLEHTINNLNNAVENTTSAESRIRDTDVADEMMRYAKENILIQAGQAMLAQANAVNQNILSLLNA